MKLLYLYIDDYHGVHKKREINFDSNYRFEFDGKRLRFMKEEVLPKDFFSIKAVNRNGGQVECVSAIIGENGSGKTSVMSFINEVFSGGQSRSDLRFIYVLRGMFDNESQDTYGFYDNFGENIEIEMPDEYRGRWRRFSTFSSEYLHEPPVKVIYFSPYYTTQNVIINPGDAFIDISTTGLLRDKSDSVAALKEYEAEERDRILSLIMMIGAKPSAFDDSIPLPCPDTIEIIPDQDLLVSVSRNFYRLSHKNNFNKERRIKLMRFDDSLDIGEIPDFVLRLCSVYVASMGLRLSMEESVSDRHRSYFEFLSNVLLTCRERYIESINVDLRVDRNGNPMRLWVHLSEARRKELRHLLFEEMSKYELPIENDPYLPGSVEAHAAFVRMLEAAERLVDSVNETALQQDGTLRIGIKSRDQQMALYQFLSAHDQVHRGGLIDGKTRFVTISYGNMSTGEMAYLSLFGRLNSLLATSPHTGRLAETRDLIVFLDEAETTLHPEWQRQLVSNVIWYFENFVGKCKIHLIFASHSPILLSDIPKGNVVFLPSKRSDDIAENQQQDFKMLSNTFGSNIYDLMRLSFGMNSGVFGGFAEKWLRKLLNDNGLNKENRRLVSALFGDELIRSYFEKHL